MDISIIKERVRYGETDQMGVAYHGAYSQWFEIGRTEFCKMKGVVYKELERSGYGLVVVELFINYKRPLRYDEEFEIHTYVEEINKKMIKFGYRIIKDSKICATGYTKHLFILLSSFKSTDAPEEVINCFLNK
jgi:acyl-CoA thioester hydrolase